MSTEKTGQQSNPNDPTSVIATWRSKGSATSKAMARPISRKIGNPGKASGMSKTAIASRLSFLWDPHGKKPLPQEARGFFFLRLNHCTYWLFPG